MVHSWNTRDRLNPVTQNAFGSLIRGYVDREFELCKHIEEIRAKWNLDRVFRFDLGQNNDGCALPVAQRFCELIQATDVQRYLKNYPPFRCGSLREKIGKLHGISQDWVILSAGIEQMIGIIANAFISLNDPIVLTRPTFFLFDNFSKRMGALPIYLDLYAKDGFNWMDKTLEPFRMTMRRHRPKIVWIASPNNPTGLSIPDYIVPQVVEEAAHNDSLVVFDEAYGEYMDPSNAVKSVSSLLHKHKNLIVMRTFSKAYGLANIRLGYAMVSDEDLLDALRIHSYNYPFGQLSLDVAENAMEHLEHLESTRRNTLDRRKTFFSALQDIPDIEIVSSDCNIIMLRHRDLSAAQVTELLERKGVFTARIPGQGEISDHYIRITLGKPEDNQVLIENLARISRANKACVSFLEKNDPLGDLLLEGQH